MKLFPRATHGSYSGLISVILLYLILTGLLLAFSNRVIEDLGTGSDAVSGLALAFTLVFPVILGVLVLLNLARLVRERALKKPGVGFKVRLLGFFVVVVGLSAIPQAVLSFNFTRNTLDIWYNEQTGQALRDGQSLAISAYLDSVEQLEDFALSQFYRQVSEDIGRSPARVWSDVQQLNTRIDGVQVFGPDGNELFFDGPEAARLRPAQAGRVRLDAVSRDTSVGQSFLRVRTEHPSADGLSGAASAVLTVALPDDFDRTIERLARSIESFEQVEEFRATFLLSVVLFYLVFSTPLLLLAILISFLLSDEIIRPLANLEAATRSVAAGDFSYRILTRTNDDLSMLVGSFNQMVSELERSRLKMIQTEKVAAWQEIAQRLAHEIKNPLTPIRLSAERIRRKYEEGAPNLGDVVNRAVDNIIREVNGLNELLAEFRSFSRMPAPQLKVVSLRRLAEESAESYSSGGQASIDVSGIDENIVVAVDELQIKQALANLFRNAIEAAGPSVEISVRADLVKRGNSRYCRLQIRDDGPGMNAEQQAQVFHPYYTTKRNGTGLGLAIVERIVVDHRGQIWFETERGEGTTFFIDLPVESDA